MAYLMWPDKTIFYSTYTKEDLTPKGDIEIFPINDVEMKLKVEALNCYPSQIGINRPHFDAVLEKPEYLNWASPPPKASAILLKWKRPKEIEKIVQYLSRFSFIDEIRIREHTENNNQMSYGRYIEALEAKNDLIYVQDDDCLCLNIEELLTTWDGEHLSNVMDEDSPDAATGFGSTMFGWGTFFRKNWIPILDKWIEKYGEDHILHREADRIFSTVLNRRNNTIPGAISKFPSAWGEMALFRQPDHFKFKDSAISRAKEMLKDV